MKVTEAIQAVERQALVSKSVKNMAITAINGETVRPCVKVGKGYNDRTMQLITVFVCAGIKYELGNDAPKGGKCGNYIKVIL